MSGLTCRAASEIHDRDRRRHPSIGGRCPPSRTSTARLECKLCRRRTMPTFIDFWSRWASKQDEQMVLNTSFNVKGQPIVNTPTEAIETFLMTGIDGLFLGNILVRRKQESREYSRAGSVASRER